MIQAEVNFNLDRLSSALRKYGVLSGKTEDEVVASQGAKLAWDVYDALLKLAPAAGSIRSSRLAALASGGGVKVRDSVLRSVEAQYAVTVSIKTHKAFLAERDSKGRQLMYSPEVEVNGKMMNLRAIAVERELNMRESARRFSAIAVPRSDSRNPAAVSQQQDIESRVGFTLSQFQVVLNAESKYAQLRWLGVKGGATEGLVKPKQQAALVSAIEARTKDIEKYITDHLKTAAREAGLN